MHTLQKSRYYVITVLVVYIVISITRLGVSRITEWTTVCSYPLLCLAERCAQPIRAWQHKKQNIQALTQELKEKDIELAQLRAELIALKSIDREAQLTEQLRGFCARYHSDNYIIGRVIQHSTTNDEQSIIIDIGAHHGVTDHMIAISHNCLVGYVEAVYPYHTKIVTVADRRSKIPIQCIDSKAAGIYTGVNNSTSGELLFISHLNTLAEGDMIITSGDGCTYPAGFAVGTIKSFFLDTQALHYKVTIALFNDIATITHVALLKAVQ